MAQVIIRNLDDAVLRKLRARAERKGIPLERELRSVLTAAARDDRAEFLERIDAVRRRLARRPQKTDSTELIRQARDAR